MVDLSRFSSKPKEAEETTLERFSSKPQGVTSRDNVEEEMRALEEEGRSVRPQVPMAGIPSDVSGIPLDQSLRDASIQQEMGDLRQARDFLGQVELARKEGFDLPRPRVDMYDGLNREDALELRQIYLSQSEMSADGRPTYQGTLIPPVTDVTPLEIPGVSSVVDPLIDTAARGMANLGRGAADAAWEGANFAGSVADVGVNAVTGALAGQPEFSNIGGAIREAKPEMPGAGFWDGLEQEIGREGVAYLLARGRGGQSTPRSTAQQGNSIFGPGVNSKVDKAKALGALSRGTAASAIVSDTEDTGRIVLETYSALYPESGQKLLDGDVTSEEEIYRKMAGFIEMGIFMGVASGAIKLGGAVGEVVNEGIVDPVRVFLSDKRAQAYVIEQLNDTFAPALSSLSDEKRETVSRMMIDSLREESGEFFKNQGLKKVDEMARNPDQLDPFSGSSLTKLSERMRAKAEEIKDPEIKSAVLRISKASTGAKKGQAMNELQKTQEADLTLQTMPSVVTRDQAETFGKLEEKVPKNARITQRLGDEAREQSVATRTQSYEDLLSSADMVEKRALEDVAERYNQVRERFGNSILKDEEGGIVDQIAEIIPEANSVETYGDLMDLIPSMNKIIRGGDPQRDPVVSRLMSLKSDIYSRVGEIIEVADEVDTALLESARGRYKQVIAEPYLEASPVKSRGLQAISESKDPYKKIDEQTGANRIEAARQNLTDTMDPNTSPRSRELMERQFREFGTKGDLKALETAKGAEQTFASTKEKLDALEKATKSFINRGKSGDLQPSDDALITQFDNLFKGGTEDTVVLAQNFAKRLDPKNRDEAIGGLKQAVLKYIDRELNTSWGVLMSKEKAGKGGIDQAFAFLKGLPLSKKEQEFYGELESLYKRVSDQDLYETNIGELYSPVHALFGNKVPADAQAGLNRAATWVFGVLNSLATKVRMFISAGVRGRAGERVERIRDITDDILSDPEALANELEKLGRNMADKEARDQAINDLVFKVLARPTFRSAIDTNAPGSPEEFIQALQEITDEMEQDAMLAEMEYEINSPGGPPMRSYRDVKTNRMTTDVMKNK